MSGIKMTTSQKAIDNLFRDAAKIVSEEIINTLTYLGEQCVVKIRDRSGEDSWFDQTGNLRSSIGYGIYSYGRKQISSAFAQVLEGASGAAEGKKMIEELASHYATAYALVCVAAMSYAEYVEAIDGKDVLASTEIYAKAKVAEYLRRGIGKAEKRIQSLVVSL